MTEDRYSQLFRSFYQNSDTEPDASLWITEWAYPSEPPIWCFMSLVGVKGAMIPTSGLFSDERRDIDRDVLLLPETVIDDLNKSA
jgi:hypothetical protein